MMKAQQVRRLRLFKPSVTMRDRREQRDQVTLRIRREKKDRILAGRRGLILPCESSSNNNDTNDNGSAERLVSVVGLVDILRIGEVERVKRAMLLISEMSQSEQVSDMVNAGLLPVLVECLGHDDLSIREYAMQCLGHIAGSNIQLRNQVLAEKAIRPIVMNMSPPPNPSLCRMCLFFMANLFRFGQMPPGVIVVPLVQVVAVVIHACPSDYLEVIVESIRVMSNVSAFLEFHPMVMSEKIIPKLVAFLGDESPAVAELAMRTISNLSSGTDETVQAILDAGVLRHTDRLLVNATMQKDACTLIYNIAVGAPAQLRQLMGARASLQKVSHVAMHAPYEAKQLALQTICMIIIQGNSDDVLTLFEVNGLTAICTALSATMNTNMIKDTLLAFSYILKANTCLHDMYCKFLDEEGVLQKLEDMQIHQNDQVGEMCTYIIQNYFQNASNGNHDENRIVDRPQKKNSVPHMKTVVSAAPLATAPSSARASVGATFGKVNTKWMN